MSAIKKVKALDISISMLSSLDIFNIGTYHLNFFFSNVRKYRDALTKVTAYSGKVG